MFNIQRPATWLFNAFGIISGGAPQRMWEEINPVVDIVQGGLGLDLVRTFGNFDNDPGPPFVQPLNQADVTSGKYAWLLRIAGFNSDSVPNKVTATYNRIGGPGTIRLIDHAVPAGEGFGWNDCGTGQQYVYIPPLCHLVLAMPAMTTTVFSVDYEIVRVLAGTKPW